jgi:hypothetical protein
VTQDQAIILCFKIVEVASVATIVSFVACYTLWAPWYRNAIGRTIVIKDLLLIVVFIPSILSIFLHYNRLTSHIAAWLDVAMIGLISPVMIWRTYIFWKIHRDGKRGDAMPSDQEGEP